MTDTVDIAIYIYGALMILSTLGVSLGYMDIASYVTVTGIASTALTIIVKMIKDANCENCKYKIEAQKVSN